MRDKYISWALRAAIFAVGGGFVLGVYAFAYAYFTVSIPDAKAFVNSQATIIQYADGSEIGRIGSENRTIIPLAGIPIGLRQSVLVAEDRHFYTEHAFSPTGLGRAVLNNVLGGAVQGGSTITQQYAKTAFLTSQRSITRKIKELVIAIKLEGLYSKDQIFEDYLNTIWFGRGSYGVATAAQVYFGKTVDHLSISQDAVLAAILNSPGFYDPAYPNGLKRLKLRWRYVIDGLVKEKWLDAKKAANLNFPYINPRVTSGTLAGPRGYVVSWVEQQLLNFGFTDQQLQKGGLVVKTTLVRKDQEAAVDAVNKRTPTSGPKNLRVALVSIKPGTGQILAMYGGRDFLTSQLNNAMQATTQAGSSFKPFALVAGLEQGIPLSSTWDGTSPHVYDDPGAQTVYSVFNYGNEQYKNVNLLDATAYSVNTVFVPLGMKAGLSNVVDVARRAGIPANISMIATPSVSLGVASPRVIDVATAYSTFAAQGIYAKPYIVQEVDGANSGVLYQAHPQPQQVFAADVMADLTTALQGVTKYGTASASVSDLGRPSAGKTGTTTDNASAWFNGYTPQMETTVALFRDNASQSLNGIGGLNAVTGGSFPARIWDYYMKSALANEPVLDFPQPANIGGANPVDMSTAIPTLDPALAVAPTTLAKTPGLVKPASKSQVKGKKNIKATPKPTP